MTAPAATAIEVEVYPTFNKRTGTGYPLRWRTRFVPNGRVKNYPSREAALATVAHVAEAAVKVWDHVRR